jgi:hypothetical protein
MMNVKLYRAFKGTNLNLFNDLVGQYDGKVVDLLESEHIVHLMLQSC